MERFRIDFNNSNKKKLLIIEKFNKSIVGSLFRVFAIAFFILGFILFIYSIFSNQGPSFWSILVGLGLFGISVNLFLLNYKVQITDYSNLTDNMDLDIHRAWYLSQSSKPREIMFFTALLMSREGTFLLEKLDLTIDEVLTNFQKNKQFLGEDKFHFSAKAWSQKLKKDEITPIDYILTIIENSPELIQMFKTKKITLNDIYNIAYWWKRLVQRIEISHNRKLNWFNIDPISKEWSLGYTNILSAYTHDLNKYVRNNLNYYHIYGREREIELLENALSSSSGANALLIGLPGIGKSAIVFGLTYKIISRLTSKLLINKKVFQLSSAQIFNGIDNISQAENRLTDILNNLASYGNGILYIEDIHNFFDGSESKVGSADFSDIILPYLSSNLQIIGSTNFQDFHATINKNSSIVSLFHKVEVNEPTQESIQLILEDISGLLQNRHEVFISYLAIKSCITLSGRYLHDAPQPEKSLKLLEAACLEAVKDNLSDVTESVIQKVITLETDIPLGEVESVESEKLNQLENELHNYIIGQDEAITAISNALRRSRAGLTDKNRPIGSFLFLGPTGVGKTETSKALAKVYFGKETAMVRLDMSEYQELSSIQRLIGENGSGGFLTDAVHDNPFSLVLLEELEKANKDLLNIFLQVLEDGRLTDGLGRTIDFTNTIIIATSNAGALSISKLLNQKLDPEEFKKKIVQTVIEERIYRPEFINRFDGVIIFHPLSSIQIKEITKLMLQEIIQGLQEKQIEVSFDDELISKIASRGIDKDFGARPLRRFIQDNVENKIATMLLNGQLKSGQKAVFSVKDIF